MLVHGSSSFFVNVWLNKTSWTLPILQLEYPTDYSQSNNHKPDTYLLSNDMENTEDAKGRHEKWVSECTDQ